MKYELTERPPKTPNSLRKLRVPKVIIDELKYRKERIENNKAKFKDKYNDFDYISLYPAMAEIYKAINECNVVQKDTRNISIVNNFAPLLILSILYFNVLK